MEHTSVEDKIYDRIDFTGNPLKKGDYENCSFRNCDFSHSDLSAIKFIGCRFTDCNLSLANLTNTAFQDAAFKNCKMLGLRFDVCSRFGLAFRFENCVLTHSSFYQTKIKKTVFKDSQLQEVDFAECDLTGAVFTNCDFTKALFDRSVLEKADFRTSYHYSIDPENNRIKKAKFSLTQVAGLLDKYGIDIDASS